MWLLVACLVLLPHVPAALPVTAQEPHVAPARVDGPTRFHTAAALATLSFDRAQVAHLVFGGDFPDALASSYAAGAVDGPILLVPTQEVGTSSPTMQALRELGVERTVLVGGADVLSGSVEQELRDQGFQVDRVAGADRYQTASSVALRYGRSAGVGTLDGDRTALLTTGEGFADALAAGPVAAHARLPLLLTPSDRPEASVDDALQRLDVERIVVVGGTEAVSADVVDHYRDLGYEVERWHGPTRLETAVAVAENARARLGSSAELVVLARGDDFPDALAASVHAGRRAAPLLLTASPALLGSAPRRWLTERCPDVRAVRAVGGRSAVSSATLRAAVAAAQACAAPLAPARAVAFDPSAGLVELDAATGGVLRRYTADTGEGASSTSYSPARHSVFFARALPGDEPEIVELRLGDGITQTRGRGRSVAVSPQGDQLAIGRRELRAGEPDRVVLEVRTVTGQVVARWDDPVRAEEPIVLSHPSWSPDGRQIAFELEFEDGTEVRVLDVAGREGSLQGESRRVPAPGDLRMLAAPAFRPSTGLLAVVDRPGIDPDARQRWRVLTLDADDGEVADVLVETHRAVTRLDFDATGEHLLYVEGHATPDLDSADEPTLFHWQAGTSALVTRGPSDATW